MLEDGSDFSIKSGQFVSLFLKESKYFSIYSQSEIIFGENDSISQLRVTKPDVNRLQLWQRCLFKIITISNNEDSISTEVCFVIF